MAIITPALVMFFFFRISENDPLISLRTDEILLVVLMQLVYIVNLITIFFIIDALVRIYDGITNKKLFFLNAADMILHVCASSVFIVILLVLDLYNVTKNPLEYIVKPMPQTVFYTTCIASFVSQVCLIRTILSHCESFKLVLEEEKLIKQILSNH